MIRDSTPTQARDRRPFPKPLGIAIAIALAVLAVGGLLLALHGDDDNGGRAASAQPASKPASASAPSPATTNPASLPVVRRAEPAQAKAFAILRTLPEGLTERTRRALRRPLYGLNWELAQRLPVKADGDFWAVPGNTFLCIVAHNDNGLQVRTHCATTKSALTKGAFTAFVRVRGIPWWGTPKRQLILGVVPDRVRQVRARVGKSTVTVPVVKNLFVIQADGPPTDVPQLTMR